MEMAEIVKRWGVINNASWVVTVGAAVASGIASSWISR